MRILIASYFFYPEGTPRATRTFELAREFARLGHDIVAYIPDYPQGYAELEARWGFKVRAVPSGFFLNKGDKRSDSLASKALAAPSRLKRALYRAYYWATGGRQLEYARTLYKALRDDDKALTAPYDFALSIGLPFSVHLAVSRWLRRGGRLRGPAVADYGDPYYYDPMEKKFFIHRFIEARALKAFGYVCIPHGCIRECFTPYKGVEAKLRIIPQGFDLSGKGLPAYEPNALPSFAYAGVFYRNHGEPGELFAALSGLEKPFRFIVYTDTRPGSESMSCLAPYAAALGSRLELRERVPRERLLAELAGMDFLVSIDWPGVLHTKLIDYRLAKRPILSYEPGSFSDDTLKAFLSGDYAEDFSGHINLADYDIRTVAQSFLALANEAKT
jgi:hypothetical protein